MQQGFYLDIRGDEAAIVEATEAKVGTGMDCMIFVAHGIGW
jgi:hypothetical protein